VSLPVPADSLIGNTLDRYRILSMIGKGGMGVVYEAEHTQLGKRVAIKLILEKYANDVEAIARFQREALAASRIGNPHIIDVSDIGTAPDGRTFVVMELLTGLPLSRVVQQSGPMPPWRAVMIMRQVLRAVGAAHGKGIVHRDLKPDNIFLLSQDDQHDFVKLLDFGISKIVDNEASVAATKLTVTGMVIGTPLYMAPEQAMGNEIGHQADLYACGVILYEMLTGKPPFEGATYPVLVAKLLTQDPPRIDTVRPGLPASLVAAVHRALEKEPANRFSTADSFAAALPAERVSSGYELATTHDSVPIAKTLSTRGRRRWPWLAAGTALAMVAGATVVVIATRTPDRQPEPPPVVTPAPAPGPLATAAVEKTIPLVTTGTLEVKSSPTGAQVVIDGKPIGSSPIVVTLETGPHHVHVDLAGYTSIDEDEDVRASERTAVVVALLALPKTTAVKAIVKTVRPPVVTAKPPEKKTEQPPEPKPDPPKPPPPPSNGAKPNPY
jgi:serine/threonine-protein kinase